MSNQFLSLKEASEWASKHLNKNVSVSNISYLVQYGKVKKYGENGTTLVNISELRNYYKSYNGMREVNWKSKLGEDLNWALSFDNLREKDTTKHVHRLHPYKGKFIPQLVEYFIDSHTDEFKIQAYFNKEDIILDPFAGSGTTLVQSNELGFHSIGIDISEFNCMISEVKLAEYNIISLSSCVDSILHALTTFERNSHIEKFEEELLDALAKFNSKYFPNPEFKYQVNQKIINEDEYGKMKEIEFLPVFRKIIHKYNMELKQDIQETFLDKWYIKNVRNEINYINNEICKINDVKNKKLLQLILSRTIRSCRATTHSDLATLIEPQLTTYYCVKHKKICKPLFSIKAWFNRYAKDTLNRIVEYDTLKTNANYLLINEDSRNVDIFNEIYKSNKQFYKVLNKKKIKGIFTSPPYVGQIDYHEQHAYAYELMGMKRKDESEIGRMNLGQGYKAREEYSKGISDVLLNCKRFLSKDYDVFIVANDKFNLYPGIAENAGMKIYNTYKRPVLNRTERDKNPYSEFIFQLKDKHNE